MNREIKFRAWDKELKRIFTPEAISNDGSPIVWWRVGEQGRRYPECLLMQYTGLKDKSGRDIYESDKLKIYDTYSSYGSNESTDVVEVEVVWGTMGFGFKEHKVNSLGEKYTQWWNKRHEHTVEYEVIGNIYENEG